MDSVVVSGSIMRAKQGSHDTHNFKISFSIIFLTMTTRKRSTPIAYIQNGKFLYSIFHSKKEMDLLEV